MCVDQDLKKNQFVVSEKFLRRDVYTALFETPLNTYKVPICKIKCLLVL